MDLESLSAIARIKIQVFDSLGGPDYDRSATALEDVHLLEPVVTDVLKALADPEPGKSYHLLSPFLALLSPHKYLSNNHKTFTARQQYQSDSAEELCQINSQLRGQFSRTTLVILIVDTNESRWTAVSRCEGMEHTILVEKRLLKILSQNSPESRLFGFLCFYHEVAHLFRIWHIPHGNNLDLPPTPKKIIPPGGLAKDATRGEAGQFVEWAGMGGVSDWDNVGMFINVAPRKVHRITSAEAQLWLDCQGHPHLIDFLAFLDGKRDCSTGTNSTMSASDLIITPPGSFSPLYNHLCSPAESPSRLSPPFIGPLSPLKGFIGPLLPTTPQCQTQPSRVTLPSTSPERRPPKRSRLALYEKPKVIDRLNPIPTPVSALALEWLIESNSLLVEQLVGETDEEWEQKVWEESIGTYSRAVSSENTPLKASCWDDPFRTTAARC